MVWSGPVWSEYRAMRLVTFVWLVVYIYICIMYSELYVDVQSEIYSTECTDLSGGASAIYISLRF